LIAVVTYSRSQPGASPSADGPRYSFARSRPAHEDTRHYRFTYPSDQEQRASAIIRSADADFERLAGWLGAAREPPLLVDLTGTSRHRRGTAHGELIRIGLERDEQNDRGVLGHETVHALASRIVGSQRDHLWAKLRMLDEGLARYAETRILGGPETTLSGELVAAVTWSRHDLHLEDLMDHERLRARWDGDLVYPMGALFVDALVRRYGEDAPRRVLRSIARSEVGSALSPEALWQDRFQAAGIDLPEVFDAFEQTLEALARRRAAEIAAVPRPRSIIEKAGQSIAVRVEVSGPLPQGWMPICRFRESEETSPDKFEGPFDARKPCRWPRSRIGPQGLWVQIGLWSPGEPSLYERWSRIEVD
jgi:hypothetical protein